MLNPLLRFDAIKTWRSFYAGANLVVTFILTNVKFELRGPHFILAWYVYLETPPKKLGFLVSTQVLGGFHTVTPHA